MENATYTHLAPSQYLYRFGEAAEPALETTVPHSTEQKDENEKRILRPKQKGIVLPMIPFYVRNDAPNLEEFLIY